MIKLKVRDMHNKEVSEIKLPDEVFNYPLKEHLIYEAVKSHMAARRQGNASTKSRNHVSGGGRKLWRQKGTGRARMGSTRSPLWRSGGTVFGPHPRDYSMAMPRKARRNALKSVLSDKVRNERILVVDKLDVTSGKTREMVKTLSNFSFDKLLIVDKRENTQLLRSTRNIPNIKAIDYSEINVYDSLDYGYIMFSMDAVNQLVEVLK